VKKVKNPRGVLQFLKKVGTGIAGSLEKQELAIT
jgi:hypothetical protein